MTPFKRILLYFLLPIIACLSYPPSWLFENFTIGKLILVLLVIGLFVLLGIVLQRGSSTALTLAIFIQGLNVIIRIMMLVPNAYSPSADSYNWPYIITNLFGLCISFYLMLRLDRTDVRVLMVT